MFENFKVKGLVVFQQWQHCNWSRNGEGVSFFLLIIIFSVHLNFQYKMNSHKAFLS